MDKVDSNHWWINHNRDLILFKPANLSVSRYFFSLDIQLYRYQLPNFLSWNDDQENEIMGRPDQKFPRINPLKFCKGFPHWALFFFHFFGQSGISSTTWREKPEFCKGFTHWYLFLFFFFFVTPSSFLFGFFGQSGISYINWREQPEFCKGFPHWDLPPFPPFFVQRDQFSTRQSGEWIGFRFSDFF